MTEERLTDEALIGRRIAAAFDRLPEPEPARLKAIEDRLAAALPRGDMKRRTAAWYWWMIFGLAAAGAAAWWMGGYLAGDAPKQDFELQAPVPSDESRRDSAPSASAQESKDGASRESSPESKTETPTIYRRETY